MLRTSHTFSTATFTIRLYAALIDFFILTILIFVIKTGFPDFSNTLFFNKAEPFVTGNTKNWVLSKSSLIGVWIIYSIIVDCSTAQGTLGKQMMNIQVTDENGNRISLKKSIARNLFKFISYAIIGLGFLNVLFDKKKRGWHDRFANTLVINEPI
ncbi:RDD family protein [Psychroflexus aestuariivivens]|uniref:RDD family protein n=1 Tax=Psychroflexus aestuariivivens TaxID=1795040 RepID=UPI000FD7EB3B|nr:RDD family protein [Psychroflexus aestuariivivens]